jgi:hypothetical protein
MARYVTRAWTGDDVLETSHELNDQAAYDRNITVFATDREPVATGLLDHRGVAIYRVDDETRCGFHTGR